MKQFTFESVDYTHAAYNLATGECLETNHANHLKHCVARIEYRNRKMYGAPKGRWVFAHGKNALSKVIQKATTK